MKSFYKKYFYIIWTVLILGVFTFFYYKGKAAGKEVKYPNNGTGIPAGWSAKPVITVIQNDFGTLDIFTNEQNIIQTLSGLSKDQLAAVYNEWNHEFGNTILEDFKDHFSNPNNLLVASNYFNFITE